jgi:O-antigen ligase
MTDFLAAIIIIAVLLFGAVEVWSGTVMLFLVFTVGLIWVVRKEYTAYQTTGPDKLLLITGLCFILYTIIQLIPLPLFLLKILSQHTFDIHNFYSLDESTFAQISLYPYKSFLESITFFAFYIIFAISLHNFKNRAILIRTLYILLIFGFILSLFAVIQKATWNDKIYWFRELTLGGSPFGPFVNRNHFAGFIGMLVPLGIGLSLVERTRSKKILFGFMTVIMTVSLFFSLSRGGIMSFVAGFGLFSILVMQSKIQQKKILAIGLFFLALSSYLLYLGIDPIVDRFYQTDITKEERLIVWSASLTAIKDFWLTGSGLGTFLDLFPLYQPADIKSIYDHAHNDYLEVILETGVIGFIIMIIFIAILIRTIIKSNLQGRTGILLIAAVSSAFTMCMHSITDFNLHILSNALCFSMVLGMVIALADVNTERRRQGQIS